MERLRFVTGGYSGLVETARVLAEAGATVIVPARTSKKARASVSGIPGVELETFHILRAAILESSGKSLATGYPSGQALRLHCHSTGFMEYRQYSATP